MKVHQKVVDFSMRFPRIVMVIALLLFVGLATQLPRIKVDTDPENMLPADQAARVFHNQVKKDFAAHDMLIVGVVNDRDSNGVFNPQTLARVHELTREIAQIDGVIRHDLLSLASIDNISQGGPGVVRFEWMMLDPPETREAALAIRDAARRLPTVRGTVVSEDDRAAGIYVPIVSKDESHRIASRIEAIAAGFEGDEEYFITGLPVAEDTFGVEMFKQMGIAAPLAGLIIFLMMWIFFRSVALILSPMIVAIFTVVMTMGLLIGFGFDVHIMSSMIPIFLMPIAVVDSVHILSEFADRYPRIKDRKKTIRVVMDELLQPMLYTSLTSAAGFASLALAPIPPVRVFGVFVAIGITIAFFLTITFIPAYILRLSDARIAKLRRTESHDQHLLSRMLAGLGPRTLAGSKLTVILALVILVVSIIGITRININDNPVRWFRPDHRIRVADRVLNQHFAGTYNAFLVLQKTDEPTTGHTAAGRIAEFLEETKADDGLDLTGQWRALHESVAQEPVATHLQALVEGLVTKIDEAGSDAEAFVWEDVLAVVESAQTQAKYFQTPDALHYIENLQVALVESGLVGKSTSIADVVKTVHRELREGDETYYSIPGTSPAVAQTLLTYQSSHRPHDLWHFVTPDLRQANLWLQLKSGNNQDMAAVTNFIDRHIAKNPLPDGTTVGWAGLTYLNVVWQEDMVKGMLNALLGSFVVVFIMMLILFRSFWFGLLAMLPLSVTIAFIYGLIGLVGKDYDMPVAVLSSLTLGLSVDFAIHFLQRTREIHKETDAWVETIRRWCPTTPSAYFSR
jgi:predicted RND superfamily exporter protein